MRTLKLAGMFALVAPLAVSLEGSPRDSSLTTLSVRGGIGSYALVSRGCEGQVLESDAVKFNDQGVALDHHFSGPLAVGIRGGRIRVEPQQGLPVEMFVNPHLALEGRVFAVGLGLLAAERELPGIGHGRRRLPTGHLRLGPLEKHAFIRLFEGVPLYSGGGGLNLGAGFRPHERVDGHFAWTFGGPYDSPGLLLGSSVSLTPEWAVEVDTRLGGGGSAPEVAAALGLTYRSAGGSKP